jgi:hypothetical protein
MFKKKGTKGKREGQEKKRRQEGTGARGKKWTKRKKVRPWRVLAFTL